MLLHLSKDSELFPYLLSYLSHSEILELKKVSKQINISVKNNVTIIWKERIFRIHESRDMNKIKLLMKYHVVIHPHMLYEFLTIAQLSLQEYFCEKNKYFCTRYYIMKAIDLVNLNDMTEIKYHLINLCENVVINYKYFWNTPFKMKKGIKKFETIMLSSIELIECHH